MSAQSPVTPAPLKTQFVDSWIGAWDKVRDFAGEYIHSKTPRIGGFRNDPINPTYKDGFQLQSGMVLVISHNRGTGDMNCALFADRATMKAYEDMLDQYVPDPETGRSAK